MEVNNLTFSFDDKTDLFQNLSLRIESAKINVFLGVSGSGKSTLLRVFAGLQATKSPQNVLTNGPAGFVFQDANLLPWKTAEENIKLPCLIKNVVADASLFNELIQSLNLTDCVSRLPSELSGGQKMRVSIARALIGKPRVLFMDEPFSALDEPNRLRLQDELKQIQKSLGQTILFVTHSFYEAVYLADRIIILSNTKPAQVVHDERMEISFDGRFHPDYQKKVQEISHRLGLSASGPTP